jgi:alpha-glucoside transport system permease protein
MDATAKRGPEPQPTGGPDLLASWPLRLLASVAIAVITFYILYWSFFFMRDSDASKLLKGAVALVVGVGAIWAIFLISDNLVSFLPRGLQHALRPFVFVGPALLILGLYLIYPASLTFIRSLQDARSQNWVGLDNYIFALTDPAMLIVLRNNVLWLVFVTFFVVSLGLVIAVMVDRIRSEAIVKSLIFLPMAISAVGASIIWRFIYAYRAPGRPQIGLLNAIVSALGGDPQGWLILQPWNNFFLILIMIWILTGLAMVVISAAVKGVPGELLEAARIDGATEIQIFLRVIIPYIQATLITITTTVIIMVLKVFDIVYVMTNGQFNTEVIANRMFQEMFRFRHFGRAGALAVILFLAVIPVMIYNVRSMRETRR